MVSKFLFRLVVVAGAFWGLFCGTAYNTSHRDGLIWLAIWGVPVLIGLGIAWASQVFDPQPQPTRSYREDDEDWEWRP